MDLLAHHISTSSTHTICRGNHLLPAEYSQNNYGGERGNEICQGSKAPTVYWMGILPFIFVSTVYIVWILEIKRKKTEKDPYTETCPSYRIWTKIHLHLSPFSFFSSILGEARPHGVFIVWPWKHTSYLNCSHFSLKALSRYLRALTSVTNNLTSTIILLL